MGNLTQEINAQRRSSESTPNYMSTEREAHLLRDQLESSTNKMFDTINANFIRLVISNLKALPISSLLWKRQDVSVGEEDGYVTAGYGPRKGERRLLPLPTLLIHLITRPSGWLKAGCMATWHAVTPTPLSDEGFVLCYRTVNFWGNSEKPRRKKKKKKQSSTSFESDRLQQRLAFWSQTSAALKAEMRLMQSVKLKRSPRSAPFTRTIKTSCYIHLNQMF